MQTIELFSYKNIINLQVIDPTIYSTRNRIVYSRTIKIYQGIDNPIHVVVKNQDQKPADMTGYDIQVDIQDIENAITAEAFTVDFVQQDKGLGVFTIPKDIVNRLEQRHYELTCKTIKLDDNKETPLYSDDNYSLRLPLQVLSGFYDNTPDLPTLVEGVIDAGEL